jgi:hypothetical protein
MSIETKRGHPMTTLAKLNALRVTNKMNPLKSWKESKAKLEAAIVKLAAQSKLEASGVIADASAVEVKKIPAGMTAAKLAAQAAKAAKPEPKSAKEPKEKPAKTPKDKSGPSISTIATELGIDPKVARSHMRRVYGLQKEGKWPNDVMEIKKVLSNDARKKT